MVRTIGYIAYESIYLHVDDDDDDSLLPKERTIFLCSQFFRQLRNKDMVVEKPFITQRDRARLYYDHACRWP